MLKPCFKKFCNPGLEPENHGWTDDGLWELQKTPKYNGHNGKGPKG